MTRVCLERFEYLTKLMPCYYYIIIIIENNKNLILLVQLTIDSQAIAQLRKMKTTDVFTLLISISILSKNIITSFH